MNYYFAIALTYSLCEYFLLLSLGQKAVRTILQKLKPKFLMD